MKSSQTNPTKTWPSQSSSNLPLVIRIFWGYYEFPFNLTAYGLTPFWPVAARECVCSDSSRLPTAPSSGRWMGSHMVNRGEQWAKVAKVREDVRIWESHRPWARDHFWPGMEFLPYIMELKPTYRQKSSKLGETTKKWTLYAAELINFPFCCPI